MEISFAKRYRIYEKSTIATDFSNLLGDKPKTPPPPPPPTLIMTNNKENKFTNYSSSKQQQNSPRDPRFTRPLTTALTYRHLNSLNHSDQIDSFRNQMVKTPDKKYQRTNERPSSIDFSKKTNLYYASPVNSDFFDNIRLNELKMYKQNNQQFRSSSYYPSQISSSNAHSARIPNNIKLKQQILNQYYKTTPNTIVNSPGASLERSKTASYTTTTTLSATNKLASYLKKSRLSNEEINKYLAYKKDAANEASSKQTKNWTNSNRKPNNLNNSIGSFSNYLLDNSRNNNNINTNNNNKNSLANNLNQTSSGRMLNYNISSASNLPSAGIVRSRNTPCTTSFNDKFGQKKKPIIQNTTRPLSDYNRIKSPGNNKTPVQKQQPQHTSLEKGSLNKYFNEKYLKQRTILQNQQQQLSRLKKQEPVIESRNKYTISRVTSTGIYGAKKNYETSSDSEMDDRVNLAVINKKDIQNYDGGAVDENNEDEDDEEEYEEEDEDQIEDEARLNQLLMEDAAMMAMVNKKCNQWLENHVIPFLLNSRTSSPIESLNQDDFNGVQALF